MIVSCTLIIVPVVLTMGLLLGYHLKDVALWRRELARDLLALHEKKKQRNPVAHRALALVEDRCRDILSRGIPPEDLIRELPRFLSCIAGCFYPERLNPELNIKPSRIIKILDASLRRLDIIPARPGFQHIARLSLNDIRVAARLRHQGFRRIFSLTSLVFMIRIARCLWFVRYLVTDLYLFVGCLAVDMYDEDPSERRDDEPEQIEETLKELSGLKPAEPGIYPEEIQRIRNALVGMPKILVKEPGPEDWKQAVMEAAALIARSRFPKSRSPLYEARIGPLVSRIRMFLYTLGKGQDYPLAGKIFAIRLETLFRAKSLSQAILPPGVQNLLVKSQKTYGWMKWPLNVYLLAGRGMFWKIAADAGWFAGRKTILVLFFGRSFDKAVRELEEIYRLSAEE